MSIAWVDVILAAASLSALAPALYLALLALLARRQAPPPPSAPTLKMTVVVPAHDEEGGVGATIRSLLDLDYPRDLYRVVVVADNCRDRTAAVAREAGAEVLVRDDPQRRGKGWALDFAFSRLAQSGWADAFVVIDADTVAPANLLRAFARRIASGASALQAEYGVREPESSWRTRLLQVALALFHDVRSLARDRLGVSCGLRGNGMCFTDGLLREVPHEAYSIVEDLEYGVRLGLAGYRVGYVPEARVLGDMAGNEAAARPQRRRWERGRRALARRYAGRLLWRGARERNLVLLDLAADLLVPPLTTLVLAAVAGVAVTLALGRWGFPVGVAAALWGLTALCLVGYVVRGVWVSGLGARGFRDLAWAPPYMAWKLLLALWPDGSRSDEWVRTPRERTAERTEAAGETR